MKPAWLAKLPPAWRARMVRTGFNFLPAFRGTGGRIEHVAHDLSHIRVRLPLSWRTRNVVGSIYGGFTTLYADFVLPPEEVRAIRVALRESPELDRTYLVELKDSDGTVHTVVERTVYIADKAHYRSKTTQGDIS
jgi:hypothetical protein